MKYGYLKMGLISCLLCVSFGLLLWPSTKGNEICEAAKGGEYPAGLKQAIPFKLQDSGKFYKIPQAGANLTACIDACCEHENCHVAFVVGHLNKCYNIECHSLELCQPKTSVQSKHNASVFVWIRKRGLEQKGTVLVTTPKDGEELVGYGEVCGDEPGERLCKVGLACWQLDDKEGRKCACRKGEHWDESKRRCEMTTEVSQPPVQEWKACEIGLHQCEGNEYCHVKEEHSKKGTCECMKSLVRDPVTHLCVHRFELADSSTSEVVSATSGSGPGAEEPKKQIEVKIEGQELVQLPVDTVVLHSQVVDDVADDFVYAWTLVSSDGSSSAEGSDVGQGWNTADLELVKLTPGKKTYRVKVTGKKYEGSAKHTLNVLEKKHNVPPIAVIDPPQVSVEEGTQIILDGSKSSDPDGSKLNFLWSQKSGPPAPVFSKNDAQITFSLKPGNYVFRLTVTAPTGLSDSKEVNISVKEARDDPPEAVVGKCQANPGDFTVTLPQEDVNICGNQSRDDKKIVQYTWTKIDENDEILPADLQGSSGPVLTVSKIQAGVYTFELTVKDEKGQTDTKQIRIHVNPAENKPPSAKVIPSQTITLPKNEAVLDGSGSSDDHAIKKYRWSKVKGPDDFSLVNKDQATATATNLVEGSYEFRLNVSDEQGLFSVASTIVNVKQSENKPPVAVVDDLEVELPKNLVVLDGSKSTDDAGIVRWKWELTDTSPALLTMLGNSSKEAALKLGNLRIGVYFFNFSVSDHGGLSDSKKVKLTIKGSNILNHSVELYLEDRMEKFTERVKKGLRFRLKSLLNSGQGTSDTESFDVVFTDVGTDYSSGRTRIVFYSSYKINGELKLFGGKQAVDMINDNIDSLKDFNIHSVDTLFCQNECSGHGSCDDYTKDCICESYWMSNLFNLYILGRKNDCSWSVLYFVIIFILLISTVAGTLWAMVCTGKKVCRGGGRKLNKRRNYRLLNEKESFKRMNLKKAAGKNGVQTSSLLVSDSGMSDSDDEDTVYDVRNEKKSLNSSNGQQNLKA